MHHAAVDGQAAVAIAIANSLFDLAPEPRRVKPPRARRGHRHHLGEVKADSMGLGGSVNDMVMWLCSTALRDDLAEGFKLPPKIPVGRANRQPRHAPAQQRQPGAAAEATLAGPDGQAGRPQA
ncbi:MAG: hypothetical protein QE285_02700 [Aquabacterium sp.]|nr:hypothetical protein [Aquabacterium sp.]